jgi:3D (Asp-Asp-Asp) domain-containing protein/predicted RNA-binding protein
MIEQSKRTEQRLVKLENILSTVMRNQARLGSRININCVYYGGQCTFGKYKCIRCLHDNRVHDGAVVTLDQCLNCTRYEPILGQIYQILDETGMNGSIVMDDMQMSYSNLEAVKQLNTLTERSPKYEYVVANEDDNCEKPRDTREDIWRIANYENYLIKEKKMTMEEIEKLKEERAKKQDRANQNLAEKLIDGITNPIEGVGNLIEDVVDKFKESAIIDESKYLFRMDWNPTFFNHQEPDTKVYPAENIIARYKGEEFDMDFEEELKALDPEKDKDAIEDIQKLMVLSNNNWVDTREQADTIQVNKYSSENFYFDGFAEMKAVMTTGSSGGSDGSSGGSSPGVGLGGSECRSKIVEMAKQIYADCQAGKAWYSQSPRTVDYTKPQKMSNGKVGYDCSSLASCCYLNAGLKSMYSKSCSGGSIMDEIVNNGGQMWLCNDDGISKASPGDLIVNGSGKMDASRMPYKASISHVMVYIGNNTVIHASSPSNGIKQNELSSYYKGGKYAFIRPKDLIDADAKASSDSKVEAGDTSAERNPNKNEAEAASAFSLRRTSNNTEEDYTIVSASVIGEIDGLSYVAKVPRAVCTSYYGNGETPSGLGLENGKTCASHNMPYGTKVYIPALKSKVNPDGIFTVTDTGGPTFDFDIYTSKSIGRLNTDVYVLSWGTGGIAPSYTWAINLYDENRWNNMRLAWEKYKVMNGKLVSFYRFNPEDATIKNHKRY